MRKIAERSDNFIDRCKNISIGDESCIMGIVTLSISFIPLALFIYAFIKMTLFYKKINFENFIILISGIETEIYFQKKIFFCIRECNKFSYFYILYSIYDNS